MSDVGTLDLLPVFDADAEGRTMDGLATALYPLCRSITGDGVRESLRQLSAHVPLQVHEVPSGTQVFDWTVPDEWNVRDACVETLDGRRVVDFREHTLHLVGYSRPVDRVVSRAELREHLHSRPDAPDWIPYRTSYYRETWGFCLPHRVVETLPEGEYEVEIRATLADGALTYGELFLPGTTSDEVLLSCHICHPSLANDNLSGIVVSAFLARLLAGRERRLGYRFVWIPGTIGSITWLARNEAAAARVRHGLVLANLGDPGPFHFKRSRRGTTELDRAVAVALRDLGDPFALEEFVPFGYDERQYCSPGFDLAVGLLSRTPWGRYPQYHTSADDLGFIRPEALAGSLRACLEVVEVLERNRRYRNLQPKCEPQLGRRGLYRSLGGEDSGRERELALLWTLNLSDGEHDLLHIAERSGVPFRRLTEAATALVEAALLEAL
jgi:aminopeptidase-like protein